MNEHEKLIESYLNGRASAEEVAELDSLLQTNADVRELFIQHTNVISSLEEEFINDPNSTIPTPQKQSYSKLILVTALAALTSVILFLAIALQQDKPIAKLVSNENAAWESSLPTTTGSDLKPGTMILKSGVATLEFRSGVLMTLEAPSHIELETPMRGKLVTGTAYIEVPENAQGFVLDTPEGYVIDHGTAFAVSITPGKKDSSFEVIKGEISLHTPNGESLYLADQEAATIKQGRIKKIEGPISERILYQPTSTQRISTKGKTLSTIRSNEFDLLHPDFLMVKKDSAEKQKYDRRAYLEFQTDQIDWRKVNSVKLQLNLVPCGLGYAANLETLNHFAVYGLPNSLDIEWTSTVDWDAMPTLNQATKLGTFTIPRSQQRGPITVESKSLLKFFKDQSATSSAFIITRDTPEKNSRGLVHAFASDSHPNTLGPTLEIIYH